VAVGELFVATPVAVGEPFVATPYPTVRDRRSFAICVRLTRTGMSAF
jgi:hypothetical protein